MSQIFSGLGNMLGGNKGAVLPAAMSGFGVLSNWLQARKQNAYNQQILDAQKKSYATLNDPAAFAAKMAQFRAPLSAGLTKGVGNEVQAYLAERGLSSSPSIQEQVMAQALAPFLQSQNSTAMQGAMEALGLPFRSSPSFGKPADLTGTLQWLQQAMKRTPSAPVGGGNPAPSTGSSSPPIDWGTWDGSGDSSSSSPFDLNSLAYTGNG